jgi:hypothetical protein
MIYGSCFKGGENNMTEVKNLNNTSNEKHKYPPRGYASWKAFWEDKSGKTFDDCSCSDCNNRAAHGGHVQKVEGDDKWYIVPLCERCNNRSSDDSFYVRTSDLVPLH